MFQKISIEALDSKFKHAFQPSNNLVSFFLKKSGMQIPSKRRYFHAHKAQFRAPSTCVTVDIILQSACFCSWWHKTFRRT